MTTFTGDKLDLLKCIAFDRQMTPYDLEVAFVILQHVNEKTGLAILSDEAIADLTRRGSVRKVHLLLRQKPLSRGRPGASHLPRLSPAILEVLDVLRELIAEAIREDRAL
jgi:hypothetical protein